MTEINSISQKQYLISDISILFDLMCLCVTEDLFSEIDIVYCSS